MKKLLLFCLFLLAGITTYTLQAQSTYRIYLRLTDAGGTLTGPVSSLPGVTGGNFFALGCAEHRFDMPPSGGGANHSPYLVTRSFDPTTSPYIRQRMHSGNSYSVEVFFVRDNGSTQTTEFRVRLENAFITRITTASDSNALQETLSFEYGQIIWTDMITNSSRGWDLVNNVAL